MAGPAVAPMIMAFDLSLTRTGWASAQAFGVLMPPGSHARGVRRLAWIRDQVLSLLRDDPGSLVVLEGYSFASRGRAVISIGELGGVVRLAMHDEGFVVVDVPPSSLKKFSTGTGNAPKEAVLAAAIRRLGYGGHDHNEADALWLRQMAVDHYLGSDVTMPQAHRAALAGVEWPEAF